MQPPAESVQDSGQCVDAPCEDAPPPIAAPTPSQAPELTQSSATVPPTVPPTDITLSVPVPALAPSASPDLPQTDVLGALLALGDSGAEGGASQGMATSAPGQAETPMAAVKLESVLDPTELSTVSAERWRSRGRGGRGRGQGGQGSLRVLHRLNKVNLKKPPDQMCRQDCIALCSVVIAPFTVKNSCEQMTFVLEQVLPGCCPKQISQLVLVILANLNIQCKEKCCRTFIEFPVCIQPSVRS